MSLKHLLPLVVVLAAALRCRAEQVRLTIMLGEIDSHGRVCVERSLAPIRLRDVAADNRTAICDAKSYLVDQYDSCDVYWAYKAWTTTGDRLVKNAWQRIYWWKGFIRLRARRLV